MIAHGFEVLGAATSAAGQTQSVAVGLIVGFVVLDLVVLAICIAVAGGRKPPRP